MAADDICGRCMAAADALLAAFSESPTDPDPAAVEEGLAQAERVPTLVEEATVTKAALAAEEEFEQAAATKRALDRLQSALSAFQTAYDAYESTSADPETVDPATLPREKVESMIAQLEQMKSDAACAEDYERAASLKRRITLCAARLDELVAAEKEDAERLARLEVIAIELADLLQAKVTAAENEDFEEAARIKDEVLIVQAEKDVLEQGGSLAYAAASASAKRLEIETADSAVGSVIAPAAGISAAVAPVVPARKAPDPPAKPAPVPKFQPLSLSDIPTFGPDDVQSGFLFKKGAKRRNWKERYFTLEGGVMRYFETAASSKELGNFSVSRCTCYEDSTPHSQNAKAITFAVQTAKRTFVMSSSNDRDYACWKAAIIAQGGVWDAPRSTDGSSPSSRVGSFSAPNSRTSSASSSGSRVGSDLTPPQVSTSGSSAAAAAGQPPPASRKNIAEKSRKAQYADEAFRLASFKPAAEGGHAPDGSVWPHVRPTPVDCARAGLFFQPQAGKLDRCRCFVCPAALYSWEPADNPLAAHAAIKPGCAFVLEHYHPTG